MEENIIVENTSGQGKNAQIPQEILGKFNWGAFLLNWIWGIGNQVWLALLLLVLGFIPVIGIIAGIIFAIWLGVKGNELAWRSKKWKSIEHFHKVQKDWAFVSVMLTITFMIIGIINLCFMISAFKDFTI